MSEMSVRLTQNVLKPKTIRKLLDIKIPFYVNSYQRGYRWGKFEIESLLNDINVFSIANGEQEDCYWLQPIVVKHVFDQHGEVEKYELIDGQQRLTTIFLILLYLQKTENLCIEYNTRTSSGTFLQRIAEFSKYANWKDFIENNPNDNKIDNFHFFQGYKIIERWFNNTKNKDGFEACLINNTKVIWYQIKDDSISDNENLEPESIFERINNGKIPLTNAELIKALYLNNDRDSVLKNEIAEKWDRIEYGLHDERLWYFINPKKNDIPNRIGFILDLVAKKFNDEKHKEEKLHTFLYFNSNTANLDDKWQEVEMYYQTLLEWFEDPKLYHYIGYLITAGVETVYSIIKRYHEGIKINEPKSKFVDTVMSIIKENLKDIKIGDLSYDKPSHHKDIIKILLLFNIETTLKATPYNYFPFDKYKTSSTWSLEHIHAQQSQSLRDPKAKKSWIIETLDILKKTSTDISEKEKVETIIRDLEKQLTNDNPDLKEVSIKVFNFFSKGDIDDIHSISNMALLDKETNSKLNNSIFPVKKTKIFAVERAKEEPTFIPICTKNVFLKYYSSDISQVYFWSKTDRNDYQKEIQGCLSSFLSNNQNN